MTQALTPEGQRMVDEAAARNGFSGDAALAALRALAAGHGTQAQFNHPELGGLGQWSEGGMIMIGDMFNQGLKARVDALCRDLALLLRAQPAFAPEPGRADPAASYSVGGASVSLFAQGFDSPSRSWWPEGLGHAASMGSQNDLHYAYFPASRRLAIKQGGRVSLYDAGDHRISGVSQQQGGGQTLTFTSQHGVVRLGELQQLSGGRPVESQQPQGEAASARTPGARSECGAARTATEIFAALERLGELRGKDILSEQEFIAKKAELLQRL